MPWIESHDDIWEHHKTVKLCSLLQRADYAVVGHLHALWHFTLRNAWKTADLSPWGDAGIERAARWDGQPGALVHALREAGFLEGSIVHGWMERAGRLVADRIRKESSKRRPPVFRRPSAAVPGTVAATLPNPTLPNRTRQTPNGQEEGDQRPSTGNSDEARQLTQRMVELLRSNDPQARIPADLAKWETEADRLLHLDGRALKDAMAVLAWCQQDAFWRGNILSMPKFREKFGALKLKMHGQAPGRQAPAAAAQEDKYAGLDA